MKFTLAKFRNLRDKLTSKIALYETDLIELLDERKEMVRDIETNKYLLLSYKAHLRMFSSGSVWDYMVEDLDDAIFDLDEFIWDLEEQLEELESEIEDIEANMEQALFQF